jgi:pentatricopeptide repeat protein
MGFLVFLLQKRAHISPDAITISTIMTTFDKGYKWKDAVELLESMEQVQHSTVPIHTMNHHTWSLPQPNVYSYSTAISSCARCGQYDQALSILERMRQASDDTGIVPNTWVYNAVLSACEREKESSIHGLKSLKPPAVDTALKILQYMEDDLLLKNRDTAPDVVTYNTLLALIGGITNNLTFHGHPNTLVAVENVVKSSRNSLTKILIHAKDNKVEAIMSLWDEMKDKGLEKNEITYRNSLVACRSDPDGVARLFRRALLDLKMTSTAHGEYPTREAQFDKVDMGNLALFLCASSSELSNTAAVFETMKLENIRADSDSMFHLIQALYSSRRTDESIWLLNAMKGDPSANQLFEEKTRIDVLSSGIFTPMIEERHYSSAIIGCLNTNEMFLAQKILSGMRIHGLVPVDGHLEKIILAYCKMSIDAASKEFADARIENSYLEDRYTMLKPLQQTSEARATAALNMMKTLASPTVEVRVAVARALCSSGMHSSARQTVRSLHESVMEAINEKTLLGIPVNKFKIDLFREVPKLHKSLLKLCARSGNITAALWYADDIQHLSSELNRGSAVIKPSIMLEDTYLNAVNLPFGVNVSIGMKGEDWKLVTVAASKAAHWKICVGTLQFLKPYIEETNPKNILQRARAEPIDGSTKRMLESQYESYSRALTASVLAFEISGQYAWAVRAINDWIEWSGRRPPKEAVFSLCRILAARSQGVHVVALIHQILQIPTYLSKASNKIDFDSSYEFAIYSQAIVVLYQNGLYDHADELYAAAVAGHFLPFALLQKEANDKFYRLDLHGMNSAIAHSAVRVSLQHWIQTSVAKPITDDLLIVTGRGRGSTRWLRPILRPEVQRMLMEEFYPPISTVSMPGNMGALKVSAADVNEWMNHQQQQKGVRLLTVAEILKSFTSGSLLRRALSRLKD